MKLGLVTDIHEELATLRVALDRFQHAQVEQVIVIGDLLKLGEQIAETCQMLAAAGAIGVWGNHDFGLCVDENLRREYPPGTLDFMTTLRPRLEFAGCHFCHVEPWLNPERIEDLWYFEGPPDHPDKLARIFAATDCRVMFAGHYHKWLAATPDGLLDWNGSQPLLLAPKQRYFVTVAAICNGSYAIYDTESNLLTPWNERLPD